ncbi:MAG: phosphogluconate dehydratase [Ponticaulis sp.]|nr:phosphogluconate dehydratase [Ponticaulis sp.]
MTDLHPEIRRITERIRDRSVESRQEYLDLIRSYKPDGFARTRLTEGNQAHASAGCAVMDKVQLLGGSWPNIGIVTAYNDMLSAHQPYEIYPEIIRNAAREAGATAQVAGGVPAMCDGVTQGQDGMELSLFSRDVIAMAAGIALSHNTFDAAMYLGVCDKIVPGLLVAAMRFGWLPAVFVPAGPMPSGLPNPEKARIRQEFARGVVGRDKLLEAEAASYHSPGTCTFYGTANSNQMVMEMVGLHLPGSAFVQPGDDLRAALTSEATRKAAALSIAGDYLPVGEMIDERSVVNAVVGLMATGGSTNLVLHLVSFAASAGIKLTPEDMADLSAVTPLLCKIYPNSAADVNHFHAAGGMGFLIRELIQGGLVHADARTISGTLKDQMMEPVLSENGELNWREPPSESGDLDILRPVSDPFDPEGGLKLLTGNLGEGVTKISAIKEEHQYVEAPARVFDTQAQVTAAYKSGELNRDVIIVVRFQGPAANGMPELHGLTPILGSLQDEGYKVALVTDGRMSGASGKIPNAIHLSPEGARGGPIATLRDGDVVKLDCKTGQLSFVGDEAEFATREPDVFRPNRSDVGLGRELFGVMRTQAGDASSGASFFSFPGMAST